MQIIKKTSNFISVARLMIFTFVAGFLLLTHAVVQATNGESGDYRRVITIYDQGERKSVVTKAVTVSGAIESAKIRLLEGDKVEPGYKTKIEGDEFIINIYRSLPVTIVDGMRREQILSTHTNPRDIVHQAGIKVRPEDNLSIRKSENVTIDGASASIYIDRAIPVKLMLYGKPMVVYTHAKTVGDFLNQKNIKLSKDDTLSINKSNKIIANLNIEIWRNGKQTIAQEQEVPFSVKTIKDPEKDSSYKSLKVKGKNGKKSITYEVTMKNGSEIERKEIQSVMIEEPVEQVEVIGAKFKYSGGKLSEEQINALGRCESGMTATRNSGNGFYGAFQFSPSTWRSSAPAEYKGVLPHQAPIEAQMQAVQTLLSRSSIYTQFPGCANKMKAQGIL